MFKFLIIYIYIYTVSTVLLVNKDVYRFVNDSYIVRIFSGVDLS